MTAAPDRGALTKAGIGAAIALAAALVAWLVRRTAFFGAVEVATYDLRMRATAKPAAPRRTVVLVNIDEDSVRRMEPLVGRWPWPRLAHASLIDFLTRGGARIIVYDVLFTEADAHGFTMGGTGADGSLSRGRMDAARSRTTPLRTRSNERATSSWRVRAPTGCVDESGA